MDVKEKFRQLMRKREKLAGALNLARQYDEGKNFVSALERDIAIIDKEINELLDKSKGVIL